jgi:hypothetical protein
MIVVPATAITRIYPQMTQMFTDEEKHLCSSAISVDVIPALGPHRKLTGTMAKAGVRIRSQRAGDHGRGHTDLRRRGDR